MNIRNKAYLALCTVASAPFALFAEGEAESSDIDLSVAEDFADSLQGALVSFIKDHLTGNVVKIIGVMIGLLLLYRIVRWGMRALGGR